jgi:hypothetical protein
MLVVDKALKDFRVGAGEPFILSVVFRDKLDGLLDMTDRRVVLSFYLSSGRGLFAKIDGVPAGDGILQFVRPGTFTADLYGQGLTVSLSERLLDGRETLATGKLTVAATADPVEPYGSLIGRGEMRATVYLDDLGTVTKWGDLIRLPYSNDGTPVIFTPAAIQSDPTPQVGETFTLVRPTGNGPVVAERLLENGVDVWSEVTNLRFTARAAGSLRYEADLQGPDGTTATSRSTITVQGMVTLQPITGSGALISGTASSGTISGKTAGSTLTTTAPGLTITSTSYTFDGSAASGTYVITETLAGATNSPNSTQVVVQAAGSTGGVTWTGVTWTGVTWGGGGTTPQPASVKATGPATIVEGTGGATPASARVTGPATIAEGTSQSASVAVTGPSTIAEGN